MESRKRRKFSPQFKREAVGLACQPGQTMVQVARDLGVGANLLGRWKRELAEHGRQAFGGHGAARDEELMRLRRELAQVKKERDFLKSAAGSSTSRCNTGLQFIHRSFKPQRFSWPLI